ncbi:hypothetical protein [Megasphaera elsdenii]|uniref:hypothetical protein n=1 Tax=Megasphaera elsdenii TaxID=907 RepID=UPI000915A3DA|nr:hypothetical protein [Megasphaera elsdenii]SHK01997.1 hypothetical protein SAMN04488492_10564 [Megasphaera elsdenii]
MTIIIAGSFALAGIALAIYFIVDDATVPIKLRAMLSVSSLVILLGISAAVAFGYPQYKVWEQSKAGEAALAKATQDRQIKVQEAEAEQEAASKQAEANRILGESIRQYPESMEQKWVEAIEKTSNQVIYLPTEASVPITESARMAQKATAGK